MSYRVNLTYFKPTGKFYSEGSYTSSKAELYRIWDEVDRLNHLQSLPGLREGHSTDFIILVDVPAHPNAHPHLLNVRLP